MFTYYGQAFLQTLYVYVCLVFSILQVGSNDLPKDTYLLSGKAKNFNPASLVPESVLLLSPYPLPLNK